MHTHKNTHSHTPNIKTNNNEHRTLTHTPHTYSILPGPGAHTPYGQPAPGLQEVVPFPPGAETGTPSQHLNLVWASPGSCLNLSDPGPDPDPPPRPQSPTTPILIRGGGHVQKRGLHVQKNPSSRA
ncbi:hypothetical protein AMECASPLE_028199, partial [Ameca splendens]